VTQFLWVPGKLPGLNDILDDKGVVFKHRGASPKRFDRYAKRKSAWAEKIRLLALQQRFARVDFGAFTYLFVEAERRRDPSNVIAGGVKLIEDALQEAELLAGDGWANVTAIAPFWMIGNPPGVLVAVGETALARAELVARWEQGKAA
jgi:hypothetical protein